APAGSGQGAGRADDRRLSRRRTKALEKLDPGSAVPRYALHRIRGAHQPYFKSPSILAQASATLRLGCVLPGNVTQPPSTRNTSCFQLSVAFSLAKVAGAPLACWNLSAQIGARAATTALLALSCAIFCALLWSCQPPQPKPTISVIRQPAVAPCSRRVSESPCSIGGNCMGHPFVPA